jgi:ABC-type transport system substrate-binding protein
MKKILFFILSLVLAIGVTIPAAVPATANPDPAAYPMIYLGMKVDSTDSPFADARVRLAVYLALDRDAIALAQGGGKVVSITTPSMPNPNVNRGYNPDLADQLLYEASYPEGFFTTLTTTSNFEGLANIISGYLLNIGIHVQVITMEPGPFFAQLQARNLEFFLTGTFVNEEIPYELLGRLLLSNGVENYTGYNNINFDSLFGPNQYHEAENVAFDLNLFGLAIVPLFWKTPYYTVSVQSVSTTGSISPPSPLPYTFIPWSKTGGMPPHVGGGSTPFSIFQASGNVTLTAPSNTKDRFGGFAVAPLFWNESDTVMTYLGMNLSFGPSFPFGYSAVVRLATYLALDRDTIATSQGGEKVVSIATPSIPNPKVNQSYNPGKATQLLFEAGYPNGFITTLTTTPDLEGLAVEIKEDLWIVGINAQISILEPGEFMNQLQAGNLEFFLTGTPVNMAEPEELLGRLLLGGGAENFTGYIDANFDSLFDSDYYREAESIAFYVASYTFKQWLVGTPPAPPDTTTSNNNVTFSADANKLATAVYQQIFNLSPICPLQPDVNPVGIDHTVWVNIDVPVAGVKVMFHVEGANSESSGSATTDVTGKATFTYPGNNDGPDIIWAYLDSNDNGSYDEGEPRSPNTILKSWVENFFTGGGNIKEGKKVVWTFSGNINVLPEGGIAGWFMIINHQTKVNYYLDQFTMLTFLGPPNMSPPSSHNTIRFQGTGTGSDGSTVTLVVIMEDNGEPGIGMDKIAVVQLLSTPPPPSPPETNPWIGNIFLEPPTPPPPTLVTISGGNFQIHDIQLDSATTRILEK